MRYAFFYDQSRCMACNACSVACKDWKQVNPGPVRYRKVQTDERKGEGPDGAVALFNLSMACNHCEDPACKKACSVNAIEKRDDGIVYVDRTKCKGLQLCITACPFAAPHIASDRQEPSKKSGWVVQHPMQKCDMCKDRIDKGEKPICVAACPAFALDFGDYDMLRSKYSDAVQLSSSAFPYAYENGTTETGPSMLIRKRKQLKIVKAV